MSIILSIYLQAELTSVKDELLHEKEEKVSEVDEVCYAGYYYGYYDVLDMMVANMIKCLYR